MDIKDIYIPIEEASELIRKRWEDNNLRELIEKKIQDNIPEILKEGPSGMIWRHIGTPDGEFKRFLDLCAIASVKPAVFEYLEDKYYDGNFTKYALTKLVFSKGLDKNLKNIVEKEKIIDFNDAKGKKMSEIKTLWGEGLVDFHHFFLSRVFPEVEGRVFDTSDLMKKMEKSTRKYYNLIFSFAICHAIHFDDFDLLEKEDKFTNEIIIPAYNEVKNEFGISPLIVKISKVGEHDNDPYWWCYSGECKEIMNNHIKTITC